MWGGALFESVCYGNTEEEKALLDLVVDDGLDKRSHRKALFADHFVCIGIGISMHETEGRVIVIDYAA